jgi:hypothetical protein
LNHSLGTNHPWVKGILDYSNQGPGPIQSGDNHKTAKREWGQRRKTLNHKKNPENFLPRRTCTLTEYQTITKGQLLAQLVPVFGSKWFIENRWQI